jgi:hypothetical protein
VAIEHLLASEHSEEEIHQSNGYLYGLRCRFCLNTFYLTQLVSWVFRIKGCCTTQRKRRDYKIIWEYHGDNKLSIIDGMKATLTIRIDILAIFL